MVRRSFLAAIAGLMIGVKPTPKPVGVDIWCKAKWIPGELIIARADENWTASVPCPINVVTI